MSPRYLGGQIFARAKDLKHQKRLSSIMDVVAMVPTLPEDSIIVSLPFGGAVLRSLGCTADEVNSLLEDTRKKFVMEKGENCVLATMRATNPLLLGRLVWRNRKGFMCTNRRGLALMHCVVKAIAPVSMFRC